MKQPLAISFLGMDRSDALEVSARRHAEKLDRFTRDLVSCKVIIALEQKHQHQGRPYAVRLDITIPGHELVTTRAQHEDAYVALRDAFDAMRRQLLRTIEIRRGDVKHHANGRTKASATIRTD
jgi:ribosomal subunit interface protein